MRAFLLALLLSGCRVGVGPTIGYSLDEERFSAGWEVSGTTYFFAGTSAGQRFKRTADGALDMLTYAAVEPTWYVVGGTAGGGYSTAHGVVPVLGGWAAGGYRFPGWKGQVRYGGFEVFPIWSIALGYRWTAPGMELYLSPKVNLVDDLTSDENGASVP